MRGKANLTKRYIFGFGKKLDQFSNPIYTVTAQPGGAGKSNTATSHSTRGWRQKSAEERENVVKLVLPNIVYNKTTS